MRILLSLALLAVATDAIADDTISACVSRSGRVRVVEAASTCRSSERRLVWNQAGPQGPPGPTGPVGPVAAPRAVTYVAARGNACGNAPARLVSFALPEGTYLITATGLLASQNGFGMYCTLTASVDGAPASETVVDAASTDRIESIALTVAAVLAGASTVTLDCSYGDISPWSCGYAEVKITASEVALTAVP